MLWRNIWWRGPSSSLLLLLLYRYLLSEEDQPLGDIAVVHVLQHGRLLLGAGGPGNHGQQPLPHNHITNQQPLIGIVIVANPNASVFRIRILTCKYKIKWRQKI